MIKITKISITLKAIILLSSFVLIFSDAVSVEYLDTRGRDFWLTYLPNSHKTNGINSSDSLFIFIAAVQPTTGKIEYYDRAGKYYSQPFSITQPNTLYTFKLQYFNYELWGYKTDGNDGIRYQSEMVSKLAFHITSIDEVSVYAHSQAKQTSDAFLVMPTDVIDKNYFVASFNSDGNKPSSTSGNGPTPSQFAVIATEDNTNVTINPKVQTEYNGSNVQKITLNKGEVYLVQAKIDASNLNLDLTGTTIDADKPVAVFGGEQKALVPSFSTYVSGSRDCLIEQIPPTKVWGKNAFITPFKQPTNVTSTYNDLYRVIAAYDNTSISINNVVVATKNKGEYYQNTLTAPATVTANSPFMLVLYKKTSDFTGGSNLGDPFMLVVPPKEQFMNEYTTINVQAYESYAKVYEEQYITIVIPQNAVNSFRLDGVAVNSGQFAAIPNSTYSYANIAVSDGVHNTKADSAFGIYIYGYGYANSFGYTGGMSFAPIDFQAPQISTIDSCYKVSGMIYDSTVSDTGILSCSCPDSSKHNSSVSVDNISSNGRTSTFTASLIDRKHDGSFTIIATDSIKQTNIKTFEIKGFTLGINGSELSDNPLYFESKLKTGVTKCFNIPIHNYGKFNQTITEYKILNQKEFKTSPNLPLIIKPGQIDTITVCFSSDVDSLFIESLSIISDCGDIKVLAELKMETGHDKFPPGFTSNADSCSQNFILFISDSTSWDSGIYQIQILDSENCKINIISNSIYTAQISVNIINTGEDMFYRILVQDSAGHKLLIADTLKGSTVKIFASSKSDSIKTLDFGHRIIGTRTIDSLILYNTGSFSLTLNDIILKRNVHFSIPQSQFPIVLNPNDSTKLYICFYPTKADTIPYLDTLLIDSYCINQIEILKGYGESITDTSSSKCDFDLIITSNEINDDFIVSAVYPNPVTSSGKINIVINDKSSIKIDLYDYSGNYIKTISNTEAAPGVYEQIISTEGLSTGLFFIKVTKNDKTIIKSIIVSK